VFGRKSRSQQVALQILRAELDAEAEERARLADAIANLNAALAADSARHTEAQASTVKALETLRGALNGQGSEFANAIEHVGRMCELIAERIESEREERKALTAAMGMLAQQALNAPTSQAPSRPRVLGGSVFATPTDDADIVLVEPGMPGRMQVDDLALFEIGTTVRCRFGDQWIDGLEVCEIIDNIETLKYRLRRSADGYVLPALFNGRDLEVIENDAHVGGRGRWSRS
jgi:hypothetical protein